MLDPLKLPPPERLRRVAESLRGAIQSSDALYTAFNVLHLRSLATELDEVATELEP